VLTNIRPRWGSKLTEPIAGCASAPKHISRTSYADTKRGSTKKSKEYRTAALRGKVQFYGRNLRRIDQAQGLVLETIGPTVYGSSACGLVATRDPFLMRSLVSVFRTLHSCPWNNFPPPQPFSLGIVPSLSEVGPGLDYQGRATRNLSLPCAPPLVIEWEIRRGTRTIRV
jgi:hypothetical protein